MILYKLINNISIEIMRKKTASQVICQNFKIHYETIFQDYKCTYRSSVLFFGRLYIGQEHFLFIANMFGLVKKCLIKIENITKIEQSSDSSLITVMDKVDGNQNQYIFGSFKNNNAYKLMKALWKGQQIGSDVFNNQNEDQNQQFRKMHPQTQNKMQLEEGQVEANFFNPQAVDSQKQKIVQITFPCSVQQFYNFFLADSATIYPRKKHLEVRQARDIKVTEWKKSQQLNSQVRQITAMMKVTGVPFVKQAGMSQVCMLKKQEESLKLNIVTQMADVPYASYFNCQQHISVTKEGDKKCHMIVQLTVVFNKFSYMKGTITGRTYGDMKDDYQAWIKNVTSILEQFRKKKDRSDSGSKIDMEYQKNAPVPDKQIRPTTPKYNLQKNSRSITQKLIKRQALTLEQKVDLSLKLIIVLILFNVIQFFREFF